MADLEKLVMTWAGLPGGTGNTVLYFRSGTAAVMQPALKTFMSAVLPYLPPSAILTIPNTGEVVAEDTGKMNATWTQGTVGGGPGSATATAYSPQSGFLVQWRTGGFTNGRAVRGRTFLVPASAGQYTSSGVLLQASCNVIQGAAQSFINASPSALVVWHRPVYDHSVKPPVLQRPGLGYTVTTANVPTKAATLTGRRDT